MGEGKDLHVCSHSWVVIFVCAHSFLFTGGCICSWAVSFVFAFIHGQLCLFMGAAAFIRGQLGEAYIYLMMAMWPIMAVWYNGNVAVM